MRIAFVYDALYPYVRGGAEKRYWELARRLAERHEVHYICWRFWDGSADLMAEGVRLHGIARPPSFYGTDGKRTVREAAAFSARLIPVLLRGRWDVIDCSATPYLPLYAAWLATRVTRTPLVATWHEFWGEHWTSYLPNRRAVAWVGRHLEASSVSLADIIVAVSPFTARRLRVAEPERRIVVENGIELEQIAAASRARDRVDLLFAGRLIDEKRVDLLLEAVHLLVPRFPELRCAIIGDGPELGRLQVQAVARGLDGSVRFHGRVDGAALFGHMKAATIFVLPSIREGFGIAVAEAQACGAVPVVARSANSAATDLIRDNVDGVVCDPTAMSIAQAVEALLSNPASQRRMAREARRASATRDWQGVQERMERVYLGLAREERELAMAR